jgi:hypothetical protein
VPKLKLTDRAIRGLPAPDPSGDPKLHWDTDLTGFAVLCSGKSPIKTYVVQRVVKGATKPRRVTVERVGLITLDQR